MLNFRTDGKLALVTGSSRGIGKAIAVALAASGADIIGVSSRPEPGSDVEKKYRLPEGNFIPINAISATGILYTVLSGK